MLKPKNSNGTWTFRVCCGSTMRGARNRTRDQTALRRECLERGKGVVGEEMHEYGNQEHAQSQDLEKARYTLLLCVCTSHWQGRLYSQPRSLTCDIRKPHRHSPSQGPLSTHKLLNLAHMSCTHLPESQP